eukprot:2514874-Pleurochrysis_carterae.AAC.1
MRVITRALIAHSHSLAPVPSAPRLCGRTTELPRATAHESEPFRSRASLLRDTEHEHPDERDGREDHEEEEDAVRVTAKAKRLAHLARVLADCQRRHERRDQEGHRPRKCNDELLSASL